VRLVGSFPIDEFNERFGKSLPVDDYHTIGGFVFGEVGRVPKVGDTVVFDGARFEVSAIDGSRIREVDVTLTASAPQPARPPAQGE
jgi:magnesium and cobalt transporter